MNKFSYKTLGKYISPVFVLGVILLFGLVSASFVDASIIVTGPTTTTHPPCHYPDCHYSTTTTTTHPECHYPPCTTTAPPTTTTTTHPVCHYPSVNIAVAPPSVAYNGSAVLHWTSTNTNYCTASASSYNYQWSGNVSLNGDKNINNLTKTTTFTITCNNNCHYDTVTDSATVYVQAPPPPTRYACNTSTWQCVINSSGPYTSLSTCQANCQAPVPTRYACNTSTWQCVINSSGPYTSLSTCQANCQAPAPTRYACNTNTYQCYQSTSGPYTSYNDCANACQAPITRYTCNTYTWQCIADNSGPYTSLSTCQNNCIAQTRYSCNYSTYQCYQTTSGAYTSYNDCANACQQTNQSLSVSCYTSPNPAQINQTVTFSSNVSGGSGSYTYYWSGATYGNNSYSQKSFSSYGNYTAYLTVNDSQNRSASTSCSVNVDGQYTNAPTLNLWADKYTIVQGESTYLRWTSTNTNYCTASNGWSGSKSTSGYESVSPNSNTTYSLTCYGDGGQITRSVTIYVTSITTNLNLTKLGRNLSTGDRVYSKVVRVTEGDVIEFYLTVTAGNNKDLYNANIKDVMPSVLSYMPGTTKIDNIVQPDTITTTGLSLGTLYKGTSKTIVFQAISLSPGTYLTYTNTAEVTADNESKITDSASITYGLVAGAATIRTGPLDTLFISFIISFISALMIWYYLRFNPKGQLALVRTESKIRDIWLTYTRNQIMRKN